MSRALGDFKYKSVPGLPPLEQPVIPEPDVYILERDNGFEFLVLACDGIFDVFDNRDLRDFIRARLMVTDNLEVIIRQVLDACLVRGSVIIIFKKILLV